MQPVFTVQWAEYETAKYIKENIKGASIFIPLSAQEKGIDFVLIKNIDGVNKLLTFQVKMSRTYESNYKGEHEFDYGLWFNRYNVPENADWNILVGIYPKFSSKKGKIGKKDVKWETIMLAFSKDEMKEFMDNVKQKRNHEKDDEFFDFHFDRNIDSIYQIRGAIEPKDMKKYLISNRLEDIKNSIK